MEPSSPHFKLVGDLEALIKVQLYSDQRVSAPKVIAVLQLNGRRKDLPLRGPKVLPKPYTGDPVLMPHSYDDSFTAIIPREWVATGLEVVVEVREYDYGEANDYITRKRTGKAAKGSIRVLARREIKDLKIGAPTKLVMNMFDVLYFGEGGEADLPDGWETELKAKLPISELVVHRMRKINLKEVVWQPMAGKPAMRCSSAAEWQKRAGRRIDGEQRMSLRLLGALKRAAGQRSGWRLYYLNICGLPAGGQGGGFRAVGEIHRPGVVIHELGHAFGLPHWAGRKQYPYNLTDYGDKPGKPTTPNAGPVWAFDLERREFLDPCREVDGVRHWTRDPMQGGGKSRRNDYLMRHFSDYSVHRIQHYYETRVVDWNEALGQYAKWNQETGAYDSLVENDGRQLPLERDVDVYSLLVTASLVTDAANIIYAPIGPYKAGLIQRCNADSADGRKLAQTFGFDKRGYNVSLRVTQGGELRTYILAMKVSENDDPLRAFHVGAVNLPARDGKVTRAELLYTPDVVAKGVPESPRVLYTWSK